MGNPSRTIRSGQRRRGSGSKTPRASASPPINPAHDNAEADAQSYPLGMNQQPVGNTDTHKQATGCFWQEHCSRMEDIADETDPLPEPMNSMQTCINYLALEYQKLEFTFQDFKNVSVSVVRTSLVYIRCLEWEVSTLRKENEDLKRKLTAEQEAVGDMKH